MQWQIYVTSTGKCVMRKEQLEDDGSITILSDFTYCDHRVGMRPSGAAGSVPASAELQNLKKKGAVAISPGLPPFKDVMEGRNKVLVPKRRSALERYTGDGIPGAESPKKPCGCGCNGKGGKEGCRGKKRKCKDRNLKRFVFTWGVSSILTLLLFGVANMFSKGK